MAKTPDNVALVCEDGYMTYAELNRKVNQLARILRTRGVKADSIVGIMIERSFEMLIGIMGIIKAGGAYLPIDPEYPIERIDYMLEDVGAKMLLTRNCYINKSRFKGDIICLETEALYQKNGSDLEIINTSQDLAYVIYTSGSTGRPKGSLIEHHSLINRLAWMQKKYQIDEKDTILQKTPFTFDVSVWELFWWTIRGAKLCLLTPGGERDPKEIIKAIYENKVTIVHFVPSMLRIFLDLVEKENHLEKLESLRRVFASGEALSLKLVKRFNQIFKGKVKLINL